MTTLRNAVRAGLSALGLHDRLTPRPSLTPEQKYQSAGRIPWSEGYNEARNHLIRAAVDDPRLVAAFRSQSQLPDGFGFGFDERCIEYPCLLSQLRPGPELILDAGSTLDHLFVLAHPVCDDKTLHILALALSTSHGSPRRCRSCPTRFPWNRIMRLRRERSPACACSRHERLGTSKQLFQPISESLVEMRNAEGACLNNDRGQRARPHGTVAVLVWSSPNGV